MREIDQYTIGKDFELYLSENRHKLYRFYKTPIAISAPSIVKSIINLVDTFCYTMVNLDNSCINLEASICSNFSKIEILDHKSLEFLSIDNV